MINLLAVNAGIFAQTRSHPLLIDAREADLMYALVVSGAKTTVSYTPPSKSPPMWSATKGLGCARVGRVDHFDRRGHLVLTSNSEVKTVPIHWKIRIFSFAVRRSTLRTPVDDVETSSADSLASVRRVVLVCVDRRGWTWARGRSNAKEIVWSMSVQDCAAS